MVSQCGLTPRSSGPSPACRVSPPCFSRAIVARRAYAARLRGPLISNVRPQNDQYREPSAQVNTPLGRASTQPIGEPNLALNSCHCAQSSPSPAQESGWSSEPFVRCFWSTPLCRRPTHSSAWRPSLPSSAHFHLWRLQPSAKALYNV